MRTSFAIACAAAMLVCGASTHGESKPAAAKQLQINLRLLEGDPLGSVEAKTIEVLSQPQIITLEGQAFACTIGQTISVSTDEGAEPIQFGVNIQGKPGAVKDGKVRLDITASHSTLESQTKERVEIRTDEARAITTARLGEVVKLRMDKGEGKRRKWVEVTVVEVK